MSFLNYRRAYPDENYQSFKSSDPPVIRPSYKHSSPVYRRVLTSTYRNLEFPGSPDLYPPINEPRHQPLALQSHPKHPHPHPELQPHNTLHTDLRQQNRLDGPPSLVFPGTPEAVIGNIPRFPARNFQVYQQPEPEPRFQPVEPPRRTQPASTAQTTLTAQTRLERHPSMAEELRARAAMSRKFPEEPPAISEQVRVFGAIREKFQDPSTPQIAREEISDPMPQSAPIHRRSLVLSPVISDHPEISDFPALHFDLDDDEPVQPVAAPPAKPRKHRELAPTKNSQRISSGSSAGRGRGRPRRSVSSVESERPEISTRKFPKAPALQKKAKLENFRSAIRGENSLALAVRTERKPRKVQPRNRKEISVSVSEIPGVETLGSKRKRVPRCRWYEGQHYIYARDGTLIGLAGMVDETNPSLAPSGRRQRAEEATRSAKGGKAAKAAKKTKKTTEETVVELGDRRSFEFREDEEGRVWAQAEGGKEEQIFVPAGASEVIGMSDERRPLRRGVTSDPMTVIEFELEPGGVKEPEKIQAPGSLRGVVVKAGEGNCVKVTVGDETKMLGELGSFMVESEMEWLVHNTHKSATCSILVVLVSDFVASV